MTEITAVSRAELLALVDERRDDVRAFVGWAAGHEIGGRSMYLANRRDIREAREAASLYPEPWWGVVVFTCFGCLNSARAVKNLLSKPLDADTAARLLESVSFSYPSVGHHRIQQGLGGAKKALIRSMWSE